MFEGRLTSYHFWTASVNILNIKFDIIENKIIFAFQMLKQNLRILQIHLKISVIIPKFVLKLMNNNIWLPYLQTWCTLIPINVKLKPELPKLQFTKHAVNQLTMANNMHAFTKYFNYNDSMFKHKNTFQAYHFLSWF